MRLNDLGDIREILSRLEAAEVPFATGDWRRDQKLSTEGAWDLVLQLEDARFDDVPAEYAHRYNQGLWHLGSLMIVKTEHRVGCLAVYHELDGTFSLIVRRLPAN